MPRGMSQQAADVEVLARLRHHRFVGRDDQQHAVDAADARQHRPHETLVPRHVDKRDAGVADRRVGKPELDGDAARFFFLEAIGIDAGQAPCTSELLP